MKNTSREIERIESLFKQTIFLAEKGLIEASLMYCRKIAEGMLLTMQSKENILLSETTNITNKLQLIEYRIKKKYEINNIDVFFLNIRKLQLLGNRAAHFTANEIEIKITAKEIIELLDFTFNWFIEFIKKSHKPVESQDLYFDKKNTALPFCIKYVQISNYQSLKNIEVSEIPVDSKFIVLTGDNGEGKTSILQAIAIGVYGDYDENSNLILSDKPDTSITLEAKHKNQTILNEYRGFRNQFTNIEINKNLIAYGASRLQLQSSESQDIASARQSNIFGIFKTNNTLLNIEYWIKIQKLNKQSARVEAVIELLAKLMPSVDDIKIGHRKKVVQRLDKTTKEITRDFLDDFPVTYLENNLELKLEQLSAGNKSILAMVGDMIIRLYNSQPETINPKELYGIVLIDELETHLHPKWQKELPKLLTDNFPLIQFIVSTHSAIVFLGMPPNTVLYNISKNKYKQTTAKKLNIDIKNILPNQILTSALFGMENIRNSYNQGIESLSVETELEMKERVKNEKALKLLSTDFKFNLPKE